MIIKISSGDKEYASLLTRQTPGLSSTWNGIKFFVNEPVEQCDWWVVLHAGGLQKEEETLCDPNHLVFVSMEPPDWGRPERFYSQFSHLVSCDRGLRHPNIIFKNGITWWAGIKVRFDSGHHFSKTYTQDYDSFKIMPPPMKKNRISVITSKNAYFPGHKKRVAFLEKLAVHEIGQYIDFYGGYYNPVDDKLDALLDYKYHLALENSVVPDYWTEKLADPLLAWCLPIYYGCPNISDYFSGESLVLIDIDDFEGSVATIKKLIESDCYEKSIEAIAVARNKVLDDYNIFQLMSDICDSPALSRQICRLKPHAFYQARENRLDRKILRKAKSVFRNLTSQGTE